MRVGDWCWYYLPDSRAAVDLRALNIGLRMAGFGLLRLELVFGLVQWFRPVPFVLRLVLVEACGKLEYAFW